MESGSHFSTDEEWEEEFEALKEEYKKVEKFKGTLADSPENLLKLFQFEDEFDGRLEKLYVYAHMRSDQDTTNSKYQDQNARAASLATEAMSAFSFVTPEILGMSDEQIESFLTQNEELKTYEKTLRDIMKSRPHVLSEKEEVLLAKSQEVSTTAGKTFGMLDNADIELPKITNEEEKKFNYPVVVIGNFLIPRTEKFAKVHSWVCITRIKALKIHSRQH